jgi:hypothetical protein
VKTVEIGKATMTLADCARKASLEPLVVTDNGTPVAVVLPLENTDLETASLSSNPRFSLIEHCWMRGGWHSERGGSQATRPHVREYFHVLRPV